MGYGATGSVGSVLYGVWCNRKCRECSLVGFGAATQNSGLPKGSLFPHTIIYHRYDHIYV